MTSFLMLVKTLSKVKPPPNSQEFVESVR